MAAAYEMVIGLEVHVELKTATKIFCSCSTAFGAEPNTQCCPVCMGFPGTLPVLNREVVRYAVKAGLAANCSIAHYSKQDRKNYFYPDLPKAYQISQFDQPLCEHGWLDITVGDVQKRIGITRIHIEEDAGKLIHAEDGQTYCDYNRCGVPLIEIVSEPDIRSAEEAVAYVRKLRSIMLYAGVSDCRMEQGSLRCDVNLSVHRPGEPFGKRTEMKNLNSFQSISRAIEFEYARQVAALDAGEEIVQETRRFDQASGKTFSMRTKENADDYRYFPDPDLQPIVIDDALIDELRREIPRLPDERKSRYIRDFGLTAYDAELIVAQREVADWFEACVMSTVVPKIAANLTIAEVLTRLSPDEAVIPITPVHFGRLCDLTAAGKLSSTGARKLLGFLWEHDDDPDAVAEREALWQLDDPVILRPIMEKVIEDNPRIVADYRAGKKKAVQSLIGQAMRATKGRGNPGVMQQLLTALLGE